MPYRRAERPAKRPFGKQGVLLFFVAVDHVGNHGEMRMPEYRRNPLVKRRPVRPGPAGMVRKRAVVEQDRLPDPDARRQVARVNDRNAKVTPAHAQQLIARRYRRPVVMDHRLLSMNRTAANSAATGVHTNQYLTRTKAAPIANGASNSESAALDVRVMRLYAATCVTCVTSHAAPTKASPTAVQSSESRGVATPNAAIRNATSARIINIRAIMTFPFRQISLAGRRDFRRSEAKCGSARPGKIRTRWLAGESSRCFAACPSSTDSRSSARRPDRFATGLRFPFG